MSGQLSVGLVKIEPPMNDRFLSPREEQIVDLSSKGLTDKEIARALGIRPGTINTYWARVRRKLHGSSRTELAASLHSLRTKDERQHMESERRQLIRELQVHIAREEELDRLVRERAQGLTMALADLHASECRLRAILDLCNDGVVSIAVDGTITEVNKSICNFLGYAEEDLIGRPVSMLMNREDASSHSEYVESYLRTGKSKIMGKGRNVIARRKDGELMKVFLDVREIIVHGSPTFVGIVRPERQIVTKGRKGKPAAAKVDSSE